MEEIAILQQQYQMIKGSREVVLDFAAQHLSDLLQVPVPAFGKSIAYLLVHNANVYLHWTANFAMQFNREYANENAFTSISSIRELYSMVDLMVDTFLNHYRSKLNEVVSGITANGQNEQSTPLEIFTHVITHEFHHKGQLLSMFRLLGHTPPDADVIRF
ncbi:DinB family protein [Mucilaginibacter sp. PAMB04274]|uniref:DinB family protein n=1 Tax=Mucilaginibacter sp. PAMB04274 TaxID=3138568 RepID=UPI0031F6FB28